MAKQTDTEQTATVEPVEKRKNLATTVPADVFDKFEDVAWQNKHRRNADALRVAIDDFIVKYGTVDTDANTGSNQ